MGYEEGGEVPRVNPSFESEGIRARENGGWVFFPSEATTSSNDKAVRNILKIHRREGGRQDSGLDHLEGVVGKEGSVWRAKADTSVAASPCWVHAVGGVSWWPMGCCWRSWSRWRGKVLWRWKVATHRSKMGRMLWSIVDRWREVVGWMVEGRRRPMGC